MLNELLKNLDFKPEEISLYLSMLATGPSRASFLAKQTNLSRPSVYSFLESLVNKGIASKSERNGVFLFNAEHPNKLNFLFDQKIQNLQSSKEEYSRLLPQLETSNSLSLVPPKFRIFDGQIGLQSALKEILWHSNIVTLSFWPVKDMVAILGDEFLSYFHRQRIENNIATKVIWPHSLKQAKGKGVVDAQGEKYKREIRIAPPSVDYSMGYVVCENKTIIISSVNEQIGFVIESSEYSNMQRAQFEIIWNVSKLLAQNRKTPNK